jgi:hypothetical protein
MSEQKPKKPRQPKSKRLNLTSKAKWEAILKSVEKNEIPITMLESIDVNLSDGTNVTINIRELLTEGMDPDDLERDIKSKLKSLDHIIDDVDFYISVKAVAQAVQPATDELLKNL